MTAPFVLGTVQLGLSYGVANRTGMPSRADAHAILDRAYAEGVRTLDTAHAYGDSEVVIGDWLRKPRPDMLVISKVPALKGRGLDHAARCLNESLSRLGRSHIDGLMLHDASDWNVSGIPKWLDGLRAVGTAGKIGVSIYTATDLPDDPRVDLIQLPANVFSTSVLLDAKVRALAANGCAIHVRSVFAQGVLLAEPDALPSHLEALRPIVAEFAAIAKRHATNRAALAMAAIRHLMPGCELVLGAETVAQVAGLSHAARETCSETAIEEVLALGQRVPPGLLDPRHWPQA